jgi:hypothetical protein
VVRLLLLLLLVGEQAHQRIKLLFQLGRPSLGCPERPFPDQGRGNTLFLQAMAALTRAGVVGQEDAFALGLGAAGARLAIGR